MAIAKLHPDQFQVNEPWIVFQVNDAPIHTREKGDFDTFVLMDAASCFILSSAVVPANVAEPSTLEAKRLLKDGYEHKEEMAKTLYIPSELRADNLTREARRQKVRTVRVREEQTSDFHWRCEGGIQRAF